MRQFKFLLKSNDLYTFILDASVSSFVRWFELSSSSCRRFEFSIFNASTCFNSWSYDTAAILGYPRTYSRIKEKYLFWFICPPKCIVNFECWLLREIIRTCYFISQLNIVFFVSRGRFLNWSYNHINHVKLGYLTHLFLDLNKLCLVTWKMLSTRKF